MFLAASSCPRESIYQEGQLEEARLELEAAVKVVADAADLHELLHLGLFADFNLSEFGVEKCVLKSKCFDKILTKVWCLSRFKCFWGRILQVFAGFYPKEPSKEAFQAPIFHRVIGHLLFSFLFGAVDTSMLRVRNGACQVF